MAARIDQHGLQARRAGPGHVHRIEIADVDGFGGLEPRSSQSESENAGVRLLHSHREGVNNEVEVRPKAERGKKRLHGTVGVRDHRGGQSRLPRQGESRFRVGIDDIEDPDGGVVALPPLGHRLRGRLVGEPQLLEDEPEVRVARRAALRGCARARQELFIESHASPPLRTPNDIQRHLVTERAELVGDGPVVHPDERVAGIEEDRAKGAVLAHRHALEDTASGVELSCSQMTALGIAARWMHLAASLALVGGSVILMVAGRSDRPTARAWHARVVAWSRILALVAIVSALGTLAVQTALLEDRPGAALEPEALRRVALETQGGHLWLARQGLLVLLLAFLVGQSHLRTRADWTAVRGEVVLLASLAAALLGVAGHAAAVEPDTGRAMANDAMHLLAAGMWIGGLWPLAVLLRNASAPTGTDARPYAVLAARRFSRCALTAMIVLALSGLINAVVYVGDMAGLVGTPYGQWLLVKLAVLMPILALAWINRRTLPALSLDGETVGRPAMRRLATFITVEGMLALVLLAAVAVLVGTPPARHQVPTWPFSFRFSTIVLADAPTLPARVLVGSQLAVGGVVAASCALVWRRLAGPAPRRSSRPARLRSRPRPASARHRRVSPHLSSPCRSVYGDVHRCRIRALRRVLRGVSRSIRRRRRAGRISPFPPPADLRATHTLHHTAGDLYWWISEGIPGAGMPGFGQRLSEEERWDLVNFVRALAAANEARRLGPSVRPDSPRIVAPDASFAVGPTPARSLRDYRGRKLVLLVFYTLPASRKRLAELAEIYPTLLVQGVDVVAVPRDADPAAIRRLGAVPPIWFPVVTEGASDLVAAYGLFSREPHAEFLIDRQGYLRAISSGDRSWPDVSALLALVKQLDEEKTLAPDPGEHVH